MSKSSPMTAESYPGRTTHRFKPDTNRPTNATLEHVNKLTRNIGRKPTFEKAVQHMVAEYGPVSALVMLMPVAFGAVADFEHMGVEVGHDAPFHSMVHAIHASNLGSGDHVGADAMLLDPANIGDRIVTDKDLVKDGQNTFFLIENQPQIDNLTSNNAPEKDIVYDQYTFDGGTQYYHAGDAGFFMVYNPSPEIGSSRLSFGNQIPSELQGQLNGELALFDLSDSALSAVPIQDGSGVSGFEVYRGGVSPDSLKLLLANHSHRRGSATKRAIDQASNDGGGAINLKIRVEDSTSLDGKPEKVVKFYALGSNSTTLLATKEIHSGGIKLPAGTPKNTMLSRTINAGEQVLVVTPTFPENTPEEYVVWSDETGVVFAGERYGDKKLILENRNEGSWVEVETAETVTMSGVTLTVDENGVMTIIKVPGADADAQAENRAKVDPAAWGCENCTMVKDETGTHIVAEGQNVARWVGTEWDWDWGALDGLKEGNPLFKLANTWETKGDDVVDKKSAELESNDLDVFAQDIGAKTGKKPMVDSVFVFSGDRKEAMIGFLVAGSNVQSSEDYVKVDRTKGIFCFKTDTGKMVSVLVSNFTTEEVRYWR